MQVAVDSLLYSASCSGLPSRFMEAIGFHGGPGAQQKQQSSSSIEPLTDVGHNQALHLATTNPVVQAAALAQRSGSPPDMNTVTVHHRMQ